MLKNNTGLDLLHLLIGSEGILGVITKAILRLYPRLANTGTLLISYDSRHDAIATVPKILQGGIMPMAIEYMDRDVVEMSAEYLGMRWPATKGKAYLMVIVIGASEDDVYSQCEQISSICQKSNAVDTLIAERREEQADILKIRSEMYPAIKLRIADTLDAAVPPAEIANFMDVVDKIARRFDTRIFMFGHAGDGNLHAYPAIDLEDRGLSEEVRREIYKEAANLGGVITAEWGIGKTRLPYLDICLDRKTRELMKGIKKVFDPNNILNPGRTV